MSDVYGGTSHVYILDSLPAGCHHDGKEKGDSAPLNVASRNCAEVYLLLGGEHDLP